MKNGVGVAVMAASDVQVEDSINPIDLKVDVKPNEISSGLTSDSNIKNKGNRRKMKGIRSRHSTHKRHKNKVNKLRHQLSALHHAGKVSPRDASRKSSINNKKYNSAKDSLKHNKVLPSVDQS